MKRFLKLISVIALTAIALVGCKKDEPKSKFTITLNTDAVVNATATIDKTVVSATDVATITFKEDEGFEFQTKPQVAADGLTITETTVYEGENRSSDYTFAVSGFTADVVITATAEGKHPAIVPPVTGPTYEVLLDDTQVVNATVALDKETFKAGETVTVTFKEKEGYIYSVEPTVVVDTPAGATVNDITKYVDGVRTGDFTFEIDNLTGDLLMAAAAVCKENPANKPFLLGVDDVFSITGRGTIVTGAILQGSVKTGDAVELLGLGVKQETIVTGIEKTRTVIDQAELGDTVGVLLRGVDKSIVKKGMVVIAKGSMTSHKKFGATVRFNTKEEGGRHTPIFTGYKPQFCFWGVSSVVGTLTITSGTELIMPGDTEANLLIELDEDLAMEVGTEFLVRESARTVGTGVVTQIFD